MVLNSHTKPCMCLSVSSAQYTHTIHRIIMKHCITNADYVESWSEFMLHALVKLKAKRKKTANSAFKLMALHYYRFCLIGHLILGAFHSAQHNWGLRKLHSASKMLIICINRASTMKRVAKHKTAPICIFIWYFCFLFGFSKNPAK